MNRDGDGQAMLLDLLDAACNETITEPQLHELDGILARSEEACKIYQEYFRLQTELHFLLRAERAEAPVLAALAALNKPAIERPGRPIILRRLGAFGGRAFESIRWSANRRRAAVACSAATIIVALLALVAIRIYRVDTAAAPVFIAQLTDSREAKWNGDQPVAESRLAAGKQLQLQAGVVEVTFQNGVIAVVEGPARLELTSPSSGILHAGKLVARIPQKATGFILKTPTAILVDVGTEFGVEVDEHGTTEVQVFKGDLELQAIAAKNSSFSGEKRKLHAGDAVQVILGTSVEPPVVQSVTHDGRRFVHSISRGAPEQLQVRSVTASSTVDAYLRSSDYLIDSSGLKNDAHTHHCNHTMWLSSPGKVQGEWVLFDLGRPCYLSSMKVWNYNEGTNDYYRVWGLAQGDIYVSSTGRGTWLTDPADWTLLASRVRFNMADGRLYYSTPDVISLGNIPARFVAIAVDYSTADTQGLHPEPRCVGLSEVQFFGERADLKSGNQENKQ